MIALALLAVAAAMLLVRIGWGGRRELALTGWALATVAMLTLAAGDGAWGIAMAGVAGMATAGAMVLHAGWTAPVKVRRAPREAPSITLPHRPADYARRFAVFVLVVPLAFVAAQWLAFGAQALARRGGWMEADTTTLMLLGQPLLWSVLMAWQMTCAGPARMIAPPAAAAILGTMLWGLS